MQVAAYVRLFQYALLASLSQAPWGVVVYGHRAPRSDSPTVERVLAGAYSGYALLSDGRVLAWGDNLEGQLGGGTTANAVTVPTAVRGLSSVVALAGGGSAAFAVRRDGTVWAWGDDSSGELGDGGFPLRTVPARVPSLRSITAVAAGAASTYAIGRDGTVWAWGDNAFGQLGIGSLTGAVGSPRQVVGLSAIVQVAAGSADAYFLGEDGSVWVAGDNTLGQLGEGNSPTLAPGHAGIGVSALPRRVPGLHHVVAIAGGGDTGYALLADGTVQAWGDDEFGELGDGSVALDADVPVRVKLPAAAIAIAAGASSGYALLQNHTVAAWGRGTYGELGDGHFADRSLAVPVGQLRAVAQLASDGDFALARAADGTVWAWGDNAYGQLGDDSLASPAVPERVQGLPRALGS